MACTSQSATPSANIADKKVVTPGREDLISDPHDNDVLCGRGGSINSHPGNERFRDLVEKRKRVYLTARFKREKRLIASSIVSEIRGQSPSGRFLTKDSKSGLWYDIGDEKARDKTSQALRENAPTIRAEIETEINHQRAEMNQGDDDDNNDERLSHAKSYSQAPAPSPYYASNPWGGGYYTPLYGYHPPADAPPPNYPQPGPYQPWEGHSFYGYSGPEQQESPPKHANMQASEPHHPPAQEQQQSSQASPNHQRHSHHAQQQEQHEGGPMKSTFDTFPSFVSSVPSSIANWTRNSFSFGHSVGSEDHGDYEYTPADSKPLPYVHRAEGQRSRVTFRDDYHRAHESKSARHYQRSKQGNHQYRNGYSSHRTRSFRPSLRKPQIQRPPQQARDVPPMFHDDDDDYDDQNNSLLSQVASHIMGSWETPISCAGGSFDDLAIQNPQYTGMEEGQEVELVEMMSFDYPIIEEDDDIREDDSKTMPPPQDRRVEIDWPSRIGCNTWLPEAPSFFSAHDNPLTQAASMEMDQSAIYSCGGSIGGVSLCQVFANDAMLGGSAGTPQLDNKTLNQMPSWERSFRSRSPSQSTICSNMSGDSDLKSMGSEGALKSMGSADSGMRGGHISPLPIMSPRNISITQQNMDRFDGRMMRE